LLHADVMLGLLSDPKDGANIFLGFVLSFVCFLFATNVEVIFHVQVEKLSLDKGNFGVF
jgi:hypothetical protein